MDALTVSPVSPATLSALSVLRPVQASMIQTTQASNASGSSALSAQSLVQGLFQRTLQAATLYPVAEPASGSAGLAQDATASLLAALNPPQATADTATTPTSTTNPAMVQASSTSLTVPPSTAPAATLQDIPANQDAFGTSLSPDFAMQTALRFGAGVVAEVAASVAPATDLGTGLVRDATAVLRLGNLQPHAGAPGPEAFSQPQVATQRILHTYESNSALSAAQGASAVDLFA
jgi:hypothetical protein